VLGLMYYFFSICKEQQQKVFLLSRVPLFVISFPPNPVGKGCHCHRGYEELWFLFCCHYHFNFW